MSRYEVLKLEIGNFKSFFDVSWQAMRSMKVIPSRTSILRPWSGQRQEERRCEEARVGRVGRFVVVVTNRPQQRRSIGNRKKTGTVAPTASFPRFTHEPTVQ